MLAFPVGALIVTVDTLPPSSGESSVETGEVLPATMSAMISALLSVLVAVCFCCPFCRFLIKLSMRLALFRDDGLVGTESARCVQ